MVVDNRIERASSGGEADFSGGPRSDPEHVPSWLKNNVSPRILSDFLCFVGYWSHLTWASVENVPGIAKCKKSTFFHQKGSENVPSWLFLCMFSRIFREFLCFVSERILKKHLKQTLQKIQQKRKIAPPKGAGHLDQKNSGFWRHIFRYFFQFRKSSKWPRKKLKFGTLFGVKKKTEQEPENVSPKSSFFLI